MHYCQNYIYNIAVKMKDEKEAEPMVGKFQLGCKRSK